MSPKEVVNVAKGLQHKSAAAVDEELRRRHLDAQDRLAVRIEIQAQAQQRINASLATDVAEWRQERPLQPQTEIERLMQRADLQPGLQYTEADIEEGCRQAGIVDPTQKLAMKVEAEMRGMLKPRRATQESRRPSGTMRASAERPRGKVLLNADGTPRTLHFS